jgi:glycosidase
MEFWLDKGILGFRIDALKHLFETEELTDEPFLPGKESSTNYDDMIHNCTVDQPEVYALIQDWREFVINYATRKNLNMSMYVVDRYKYIYFDEIQFFYSFQLIHID